MSLTAPPAFTWSNASSVTTIDRSQPLRITWTGGDPNGQVQVSGRSFADPTASVSFTCYAKGSDLQLTVPATILSLLPPATNQNNFFSVSSGSSSTGAAGGLDTLNGAVVYSFQKSAVAYH